MSWDNFNESGDLQAQVENYKNLTGYYPQSVHVDKIYRNRKNRAWCKERGIRISGAPLGRPPKKVSPQAKKQAQLDERIRNTIEGKFGQAKRRYGLNRILAKLRETSETAIAISFLVVNLSTLLRQVYCLFLSFFLGGGKEGFTDYLNLYKASLYSYLAYVFSAHFLRLWLNNFFSKPYFVGTFRSAVSDRCTVPEQ